MKKKRTMLGTALFNELEKLRQSKGDVTAEDAGAIVTQLMLPYGDNALQQEIIQMIKDIEDAKSEIMALSSNSHTNKKALSDASLHLDTVIKSTEEATHSFMDAADTISHLADGIGGEKERDIKAACTHILEACTFQDLASQRITKVIKLIQTLENHIMNLLRLFDIKTEAGEPAATTAPPNDNALLSGPQLPDNAISQNDADALFKSIKTEG